MSKVKHQRQEFDLGFDTEYTGWRPPDVPNHDPEEEPDIVVYPKDISDDEIRDNIVLCVTAAVGSRNFPNKKPVGAIHYLQPNEAKRKNRPSFQNFIAKSYELAVNNGFVKDVSTKCSEHTTSGATGQRREEATVNVNLLAHFSRADLCAFSDWELIRTKFDNCAGTFVTLQRPYLLYKVRVFRNRYAIFSIRLYDTMLLAPNGKKKLSDLGEAVGQAKPEIDPHDKENMGEYQRRCPKEFEIYAIGDSVIVLLWFQQYRRFLEVDLDLKGRVPPTIAAAGVKRFKQMVKDDGYELNNMLGGVFQKEKFTAEPDLQDHVSLFSNAYHGGRNEAYSHGFTEREEIYDYDFKGCYATVLADMRMLDPTKIVVSTDLDTLAQLGSGISAANVVFKNPQDTRYPSLPVRLQKNRGLLYPLEGRTQITGSELMVAIRMGVEIEVRHGVFIPYADNEYRPFLEFSRLITAIRKKFKGTIWEKVAKDIGNSVYGKLAQAVDAFRTSGTGARAKGKSVFNTRTGDYESLPPSSITSPFLASHITGLARAMCSECMAGIPAHRTAYTTTTDGFLTNATHRTIDFSGPTMTHFSFLRRLLSGDPEVIEEKHRIYEGIVIKTRGTITSIPIPGYEPILARAGNRPERKFDNDQQESCFWKRIFTNRKPGIKFKHSRLWSLKKHYGINGGLQQDVVEVSINLEWDGKRRPNKVQERHGVLQFDSIPWRDKYQATEWRDDFDTWRKKQHRVMRNLSDYHSFNRWRLTRDQRVLCGMNQRTTIPPLITMFARAVHKNINRPKWKLLAEILEPWIGYKRNTLIQAGKRGTVRPITMIESSWEVDALDAMLKIHPEIDAAELVAPNTEAAEKILNRLVAMERPRTGPIQGEIQHRISWSGRSGHAIPYTTGVTTLLFCFPASWVEGHKPSNHEGWRLVVKPSKNLDRWDARAHLILEVHKTMLPVREVEPQNWTLPDPSRMGGSPTDWPPPGTAETHHPKQSENAPMDSDSRCDASKELADYKVQMKRCRASRKVRRIVESKAGKMARQPVSARLGGFIGANPSYKVKFNLCALVVLSGYYGDDVFFNNC